MSLPIPYPYPPMEAETAGTLPEGPGWLYEPKWDGFRSLVFRDGDDVRIQSKAAKPLERYFPDVVQAVRAVPARRFVLDGEIVIPVDGRLSFDELLLRVHPAESRVRKLADAHPARLMAFDLLADERGRALVDLPLEQRRPRLEAFGAPDRPPGIYRPCARRPQPLEHRAVRRVEASPPGAGRRGGV